ncbi:MAG: tRNA-(ms[2]io[6]A)-hydroxylase [Legionellales bacterium]|nr:tRNA-(ms[2]io[6]A)-hydroxylase [Legionellales bacterium]|tara:strand:- start:626 stop:1210 length:585 start_codon:yes stop_codon:yes gene_type:complete
MSYQLTYTTDLRWAQSALANLGILLNDHAILEKKAAVVAIDMMKYFPKSPKTLCRLSKLAREEMRHFELVTQFVEQNSYDQIQMKPVSYMRNLFSLVDSANRTQALRDRLLIASIIEARAHERFDCLIPLLNGKLAAFYTKLSHAEKRHQDIYFTLCLELVGESKTLDRLSELLDEERRILLATQDRFGFFSCV